MMKSPYLTILYNGGPKHGQSDRVHMDKAASLPALNVSRHGVYQLQGVQFLPDPTYWLFYVWLGPRLTKELREEFKVPD